MYRTNRNFSKTKNVRTFSIIRTDSKNFENVSIICAVRLEIWEPYLTARRGTQDVRTDRHERLNIYLDRTFYTKATQNCLQSVIRLVYFKLLC